MPLQRIFQKKEEIDTASQQEYIEQLFKMAHSDGHMDECEYHFILKVAQGMELNVDFEKLHHNLDKISFNFEASNKFGFDLLFDLSWLILVDGEIDRKELELGVDIATKMGYQANQVKEIVIAIADHKKMGLPPAEIKDKLRDRFRRTHKS